MRVVFGECEFDSGRRVLLRHGSAVPLSPKAFQLLELLLDRRPEAVAKTELVERLWPETFVSDASLHNLVAEIRAALGDAPRAARYIRTVPRYGYAFHGDARPAPAVALISSTTPAGPRLVVEPRRMAFVRRAERGGPRSRLRRPHRFGHALAPARPNRRHEWRGHRRGSGQQERHARERACPSLSRSRSGTVTKSTSVLSH